MFIKATLPSIACGAIFLTTAALSVGCVELADDPEGTADPEAVIAPVAATEPGRADLSEAAADPGFAGEPGAMLVRELAGEDGEGGSRGVAALAASAVGLYKDVKYAGASRALSPGVYNVDQLGISNDSLSSLRIPSGLTAKIYEHSLSRGASQILTSDTPDLRARGFNDKTSSVAIHGPIAEPGGAPYSIGAITGTEDLKYKVASNPTVIKKLATFADMLGFGWCGGTQSPYVGENFDVARNADGSYSMKAHYNKNDPYASGYWADKRLEITISNFRLGIDPATFTYGPPTITSLTPIALDTGLAINPNQTPSTIGVALDSSHTNSYSHETNVSFTQGINVGITTKAEIPFFGGGEVTTEFSFSSTQGWKDTTTTADVVGTTWTYSTQVPAVSKKLITLVGLRTRSNISYSAVAYVTFDVSFHGFLRWGGNARSDHPTNRPFVTATFGRDDLSGLDSILDQYDHSYIANYSGWDWHWIKAFGRGSLGSTMGFFRRGITVPLSGRFTGVMGTNVTFEEGVAQPL